MDGVGWVQAISKLYHYDKSYVVPGTGISKLFQSPDALRPRAFTITWSFHPQRKVVRMCVRHLSADRYTGDMNMYKELPKPPTSIRHISRPSLIKKTAPGSWPPRAQQQ